MYGKTWKNLPLELAWTVFDQVNLKQDLIECQLTCKSWNLSAQKAFYRDINLNCTISNIKKLTNTLNKSTNHLGTLVTSVTLFSSAHNSTICDVKGALDDLLISLKKNCPKIRSINLDLSRDLLLELDIQFWQGLKNKEWTHLELLAICDKEIVAIADKYTDIAMFYKENIKTLELRSSKPIDITAEESENKNFDLLKKGLSQFTSLNHLKIEVNSNNNIFQFDSLVSHSLESLEINTILDNYTYIPREKDQEIPNLNTSNVKKCSNLRQLDLKTVFSSNNALEYLMRKFPCLKSLKINDCRVTNILATILWKQGAFHLLEDTMHTLVEYLIKIPHFDIDNMYFTSEIKLIERLIEKSMITQKASYYISINYEVFRISNIQRINIRKNADDDLSLINKNTKNDIDLYSVNIFVNHNRLRAEKLLQSTEHHLVGLKIKESLNEDWSYRKADLDSILSKHSNLKAFELQNAEPTIQNLCNNNTDVKKYKSVETLVFKDCLIDAEIFPGLSKRLPNLKTLRILGWCRFRGLHSSNNVLDIDLAGIITTFPALKVLELHRLAPFVNHLDTIENIYSIETLIFKDCTLKLDLFSELSKYLPNLKTLSLLGFIKYLNFTGKEVFNIDLSNLVTSFPSLKTLQIYSFRSFELNAGKLYKNGSNELVLVKAC